MRDAEKDLAMCEAATPGPWHANTSWFASEVTTNPEGSAYAWVCQLWYKDEEVMQNHKANAQFIAESREALPYWINRAQAAEAEIERLKAENVRVVAASGAGYEKLLEALREIDTHIRATADPVPYIVATLKQALPEYKGWDDASRT